MKVHIPQDWCMEMALLEGNAEVGAGLLTTHADVRDSSTIAAPDSELQASFAFGQFVNLMRRQRRLTLEQMADDVHVDLPELIAIERNPHHTPHLRTAYQLAKYFDLLLPRVLQLAGLAAPNEPRPFNDAVPFAANSDPSAELTEEERAVLDAFISVLNEQP